MADLTLRLEIRIAKHILRPLLVLCLMAGAASELASENVTLSTYYPAPSGIYTQMITTANSYLARDGGRVGVGTANPGAGYKLDVVDTVNNGNAVMRIMNAGANGQAFVATRGATREYWTGTFDVAGGLNPGAWGVYDASAGQLRMLMTPGGNLAVGTAFTTPQQTLDVQGTTQLRNVTVGNPAVGYGANRGYLNISNTATGCNWQYVSGGAGGAVVCGGGYYATWSMGLYVEGWNWRNRGGQVIAYDAFTGRESVTVWALDYATNVGKWMTLQKDDSVDLIWCCPR